MNKENNNIGHSNQSQKELIEGLKSKPFIAGIDVMKVESAILNQSDNSPEDTGFRAEAVLEEDSDHHQHTDKGVDEKNRKTIGLALSGGGIRSASFATGVVQQFLKNQKNDKVGKFDELFTYLSTVSGGGYLGATLTWLKFNKSDLGAQLDDSEGVRNKAKDETETCDGIHGSCSDKNWLDYVRQHGSYMKPNTISTLSLVSVVARNMVLSLFVYWSILVLLFLLFLHNGFMVFPDYGEHELGVFNYLSVNGLFYILSLLYVFAVLIYPVATYIGSFNPVDTQKLKSSVLSSQSFLGSIWLMLITIITYAYYYRYGLDARDFSWTTQFEWDYAVLLSLICVCLVSTGALIITLFNTSSSEISSNNYKARLFGQKHAGKLLGGAILFGLLSVLPYVYSQIKALGEGSEGSFWQLFFPMASGGLGLVGTVFQFVKGRSKNVDNGILTQVVIILSSALLVISLILGAYVFVANHHVWLCKEVMVLIVLVVFLSVFINLNYFGIGRMYRDRLMETFLPNLTTIKEGNWNKADEADQVSMKDYSGIKPYHIVNTNVVLVDSKQDRFRGRGGDNFIISPEFCGSEATGYYPSKDWLNGRMNLPTAIAVSGAAVNPHAGVSGRGVTRNRLVSFILSLLQIRMGYWAPNPRKKIKSDNGFLNALWRAGQYVFTTVLRANYLVPGIRQGLFGRGLHGQSIWLELTDGGHFDNTGVYELIRRELDVIVLSMASADPDYKFEDLANVIQKARVDFGVDVSINYSDFDKLIPDPDTGFSKSNYAIADITYASKNKKTGQNKKGKLVVIATTKQENVSPVIASYIKSHPSFPHQSTGDQFYDEQQFEVYRELGFRAAGEFIQGHEVEAGLFK